MNLDFVENEHEMRAFGFAIGVIVLGGLAVTVFVILGSGIVFYVIALLALILGFYMAYHISRGPVRKTTVAKTRRSRARKQ